MSAPGCVLVVTGGRDFRPWVGCDAQVRSVLHHVGPVAMFEGEATGADRYAAGAARALNIPVHTVPALWSHEGRKAGPVRNARMLQWAVLLGAELRLPVRLLAFPGGVGTANMVKRARARGLDVIDFRRPS